MSRADGSTHGLDDCGVCEEGNHQPQGNDRNGRRDGRRPGGEKKRFGDKPAFAGERKPEGAKPFKGNNKRRFGGKRPAARAA